MKTSVKWIIFLVLLMGVVGFIGFKRCSRPKPRLVLLQRGDMVEAVYGIGTLFSSQTYQLKVAVPATVTQVLVKEGDFIAKGRELIVLDSPVLAPFSGTVTQVNYQLGETVSPQTPVLTLTDLSQRYMKVSLDQDAAIFVKPGQQVKLSFENVRDHVFKGRVRSVFSHEQQFLVFVDVEGLPPALLPGMTADVAIEIKIHPQVWTLPLSAIKANQVRILREGKPLSIPVKLGLLDGDLAEVVSANFKVGDQLVLEPLN